MGPRLDERGKLFAEPKRINLFWLQWGRVWMNAESPHLIGTKTTEADASMGPRLDERGKRLSMNRIFMAVLASMGPRLDERGKPSPMDGGTFRQEASMGPRLDERGKEGRELTADESTALQWGRVWMNAERYPRATNVPQG